MNNPLIDNKVFILLTAASGAGKSTLAEYLQFMFSAGDNFEICCADDFFVDKNGDYNFNANDLGKAHSWCLSNAKAHFNEGIQTIVLANTNTRPQEYVPYINAAKAHGYKIVSLILQNLEGTVNVHGVPEKTLETQKERIKQNLKL